MIAEKENKPFIATTPGVVLACLASCFLWGSAFPCVKIGYELFGIDAADVPSILAFAGTRFVIAGLMVVAGVSVATRRDIVPIHFIGQNSSRFYTIAEWCKRLRIKFNLAMLFLPDEMYRSQHGEYKVVIGKPIPWESFDKSRTALQWAQVVREEVYKL